MHLHTTVVYVYRTCVHYLNDTYWILMNLYWIFSDPLHAVQDSVKIVFCKTKATECISKFTHNGKTYQDTCTFDSIGGSDKREEFLWCATEVDKDDKMVNWGVCDLSTCKSNISCLFTNAKKLLLICPNFLSLL